MTSRFAATVVGAGPSGLAAVGNLLAQRGITSRPGGGVLWIDPLFSSGRLDQSYREVPSNTKVSLFLDFAQAVKPFRDVIDAPPASTGAPNAITALRSLNPDQHCPLAKAVDMCKFLTEGLAKRDDVTTLVGTVTAANYSTAEGVWQLSLSSSSASKDHLYTSNILVLCTGSHPRSIKVTSPATPPGTSTGSAIKDIHLDIALTPSKLPSYLPSPSSSSSSPTTVAVIGSSHSAILALLNLYTLATTTHPDLRIKWFSRSPLLYAVPKGDWILHDNTGLKGVAATWARAHLEPDTLTQPPQNRIIEKVALAPHESFTASPALQSCTHIVQAIGYEPNPLPSLSVDHHPVSVKDLAHDSYSGAFTTTTAAATTTTTTTTRAPLPSLYGAGIAWPETVTDPEGNVESAVGLYKFMKFLRRVVPEWTKERFAGSTSTSTSTSSATSS